MIPSTLKPSPLNPTNDQRRGNIYKHLREMFPEGSIFEIRCHLRNEVACTHWKKVGDEWYDEPGTAHAISGKFDDPVKAANSIIDMESAPSDVDVVWVTVNPIAPEAAKRIGERSMNHLKVGARATGEADVDQRWYWYADFDTVRPKGKHASEGERQQGYARLLEILNDLMTKYGWPEPRIIDSGNGFHCYWIADKSPAGSPIWSNALVALDAMYTDNILKVDTVVGNASRVAGVPGSWNRGAKYEPTPIRPARVRRVIHRPENWTLLTYGKVQGMAERFQPGHSDNDADGLELVDNAEELLDEYFGLFSDVIEVAGEPHARGEATIYDLLECPFKGAAHSGAIGVTSIMLSDTRIGFSCLHPDHAKYSFKDLTTLLEAKTRQRCGIKFYANSATMTERCMELLESIWLLDPEDVWVEGQVPVECEDEDEDDEEGDVNATLASPPPSRCWTRPVAGVEPQVEPALAPTVAPALQLAPEPAPTAALKPKRQFAYTPTPPRKDYWHPVFQSLAEMDEFIEAMD